MTAESTEGEHDADVVPLHPDGVPQADPGLLPAVRAESRQLDQVPAQVIYSDITSREGERRPVIPVHLQRENIRATVAIWAALNWHRARYHSLRLPVYLLAVAVWAVIGVFRLVMRQIHWWWVLESHALRSEAVINRDSREWLKLRQGRQGGPQSPRPHPGRGGRRAAHRRRAAGGLRSRVVLGRHWGPCRPAAGQGRASRGAPDHQPGDRPAGLLPAHARDHRPRAGLAEHRADQRRAEAGQGRPRARDPVHYRRDERRAGMDLSPGPAARGQRLRHPRPAGSPRLRAAPPAVGDLARRGARGAPGAPGPVGRVHGHQQGQARGVPAGEGEADRHVRLPAVRHRSARQERQRAECSRSTGWSELRPGQGKSAAVRLLAAGAALDPLADLWIHELAGKGDLDPLGQVCHRYCSGMDAEAIAYAADSARLLRAETERRSRVFKQLKGSGALPDGKVTRELAAAYRELRPLVAAFDEVQNLLTDRQHGEQAAEDLAYVIRVGRAYGIIAVLSTQRPDAKIIPTSITGLIVSRCCMMTPDQPANDFVLGTSSYKRGYDSTVFRPKIDAGLAWLKGGEEGIPQIVRTYYLDLPATERIAARARVMRERAGVLSGYALGETFAAEHRDVLADVLAVFGGAPGMHWDTLADRLADRWPDRWADLTGEAISAQLRPLGVPSVMVSTDGVKARGCRRVAVERESAR